MARTGTLSWFLINYAKHARAPSKRRNANKRREAGQGEHRCHPSGGQEIDPRWADDNQRKERRKRCETSALPAGKVPVTTRNSTVDPSDVHDTKTNTHAKPAPMTKLVMQCINDSNIARSHCLALPESHHPQASAASVLQVYLGRSRSLPGTRHPRPAGCGPTADGVYMARLLLTEFGADTLPFNPGGLRDDVGVATFGLHLGRD